MAVLVPSKGLKHYKTRVFLRCRGPGRAEAPGQEGVGGGKPPPVGALERRGSADFVRPFSVPAWAADCHHFDARICRFAQDAAQEVPWPLLAPFWFNFGSFVVAFGLNIASLSVPTCLHFSPHSTASVQTLSYVSTTRQYTSA